MKTLFRAILAFGVIATIATSGAATAQDVVSATGAGVADRSRFPSEMQAKVLSRRAAMADAQRNLLETIEGVRVTAGTTVENMMVTSDRVGTRVKGMIRGAFIIDEESRQDGGSWVTEITLGVCVNQASPDCRQKPTLQQAVATALAESETVAPYSPDDAASVTDTEVSSGLIVDVSDVDFSPFLDVRIRTASGDEIYGPSTVSTGSGNDWLNYAADLDSARAMTEVIGNDPMVIKAESATDGYVVIVSGEDAAKVHSSDQRGKFLRDGRVIFVTAR